MNNIKDYLTKVNETKKALSIYLSVGYPVKENFEELVLRIFDAGADIIELGIPFSDPLADGPTIQQSSQNALNSGVDINYALEIAAKVKDKCNKPIIFMTYANPILCYGISNFIDDAHKTGADGLIVPDLPPEESKEFFAGIQQKLDVIHLTTPASTEERIKIIDNTSTGFVYCVSVLGTTGVRRGFSDMDIDNISRTYNLISKNKMLVGFGISSPKDIKQIAPFGDGAIIGSAIIKSLANGNRNYPGTINLIKELNTATFL